MNWGIEDLVAAVALLGGAGLALALVLRTVPGRLPRIALAGGIVLVTLALWAELAVGIF
jgi:hypothetical protein